MSFGCSFGDELLWLQEIYPDAEIIGVEIAPNRRREAIAKGFTVWEEIDTSAEKFDLVVAFHSFMYTHQEITDELKFAANEQIEKFAACIVSHGLLLLVSTPVSPPNGLFVVASDFKVSSNAMLRQVATDGFCLWGVKTRPDI